MPINLSSNNCVYIVQVNEKIIDYTTDACKPSDSSITESTCAEYLANNRGGQGGFPTCSCTIPFNLDEDFHVSYL